MSRIKGAVGQLLRSYPSFVLNASNTYYSLYSTLSVVTIATLKFVSPACNICVIVDLGINANDIR